jgi:acyl-ACP thioesterase
MKENRIYDEEFQILSFQVDFRGRAHLSSLLNYLQDAARGHSIREKFSVFDLFEKGVTWVVSRYHANIHRYPVLGEKILVRTWASGKDGYYALRDFKVYDEKQNKILLATSSWMIIDLNLRRPIKVRDLFPDELVLNERALEDDFPALPIVETLDHKADFRVLFEDLDFNRHVNNVVYSRWAVEGMPQEILFSHRPMDLEINYRSEAFYGDGIEVITQRPASPDGLWVQQIFDLKRGKEVARLRSRWVCYENEDNVNKGR